MDQDGYAAGDSGGTDCDDTNPHIHPGATEINADLVDNNCDGVIDTDGIDFTPACTTDRNRSHVRAKRASHEKNGNQGKGYYAQGSGQFLSKDGGRVVELKEITPGYYEEGRCQPFPICTLATVREHLRAWRMYLDKSIPQEKRYYISGSDEFLGTSAKTLVELKETDFNRYEEGRCQPFPICTFETIKVHLRARRVYFDKSGPQGKGYYISGSDEFLGTSAKTLVELKETDLNRYEEGRCQPFPICTSGTIKEHLRARRVYFDKNGPQGKGYYATGSHGFAGKPVDIVVELKETALNYYETECN